jgi:nitrogen fixation protein NifU and related proteins
MGTLDSLYQEVILDHGRHPRCAHFPDAPNHEAEGRNPLCGDRIVLKLRADGDVVADIGFEGAGCAISTAAASTMAEAVRGKTRAQISDLSRRFRELVTGKADPAATLGLGKLAAFAGVSAFPMRVKCATLAWHTLEAALDQTGKASTE